MAAACGDLVAFAHTRISDEPLSTNRALLSATVANECGDSGLDTLLGHTELLAATPKTKKKSRRRRDAEADLTPSSSVEKEDRGSSRTERDDASEPHDIASRHSTRRGSRPQHHAPARAAGQQSISRSRSATRASGTASSSNTSSSAYRRPSVVSKPTCNPELVVTASVAHQSLTSSASAVWPSKHAQLERNRLLSRAHVERREQVTPQPRNDGDGVDHHNNNEDAGHDEEARGHDHPEIPSRSKRSDDWLYEDATNITKRSMPPSATLPSRAWRYRSTPDGSANGDPLEDAPRHIRRDPAVRAVLGSAVGSPPAPFGHPPSRQRRAFPTHLVDANGFLAPTPGNMINSSSNNTRLMREENVHSAGATSSSADTTERPLSRYMTGAKRCPAGAAAAASGASFPAENAGLHDASPTNRSGSESQGSGLLPSRRCVESVYSFNQVNHDPKTDGFADVDESVPPPFRIEIATSAACPGPALPVCRTSPVSFSSLRPQECSLRQRTNLQSRRWSSFSNQEQLQQMAAQSGEHHQTHNFVGSAQAEDVSRRQLLEWFGEDDQVNNAHLFETVVSVSSPRFGHDLDADTRSPASDSALERSEGRSVRSEPPAVAVPTSKPANRISDQQWILASNNPFFYSAPAASEFDDMDPETAIAQTPLCESGDLMTIATETSDLHLDDFILGELQPMPLSIAVGTGGVRPIAPAALSSNPSPPLHTSLGRDFLSLFAQH